MMSKPPSEPAPKDSEPGPSASIPDRSANWEATDKAALRGPAPATCDAAPSANDTQLPTIGHIGRYALKYRLGEGGNGTVYAAHDPLLSRLIAVKTLRVEDVASARESFNALFLNEGRAAAGLSHPHIVTVFDAGISDDRAYIAMELLHGRDLRQLRQDGWRATAPQAALIVRRVADALGYAHARGVVHRDIKPANIFMIGRTQPKVLDFGIARVAHRHDSDAAPVDIAGGSPYYMAPEQVLHRPVDRRADVFSLGVVLYELLTDLKPFSGDTLDAIIGAVLEHDPMPANRVDASVPQALADIAAKAMAKQPEHRYRSARAFARDLRDWLDQNTVSAEAEAKQPDAPDRRPKTRRFVAALAVALVGAGVAWTVAAPDRGKPPTGSAAAASRVLPPPAVDVPVGDGSVMPVVAALGSAPEVPTEPALESDASGPAGLAADPIESTQSRRTRQGRATARSMPATASTPAPTGRLRLAISPWGEVEVDGQPAGISPPLTGLSLREGSHWIVIRNAGLPLHRVEVEIRSNQTATVRHRF